MPHKEIHRERNISGHHRHSTIWCTYNRSGLMFAIYSNLQSVPDHQYELSLDLKRRQYPKLLFEDRYLSKLINLFRYQPKKHNYEHPIPPWLHNDLKLQMEWQNDYLDFSKFLSASGVKIQKYQYLPIDVRQKSHNP